MSPRATNLLAVSSEAVLSGKSSEFVGYGKNDSLRKVAKWAFSKRFLWVISCSCLEIIMRNRRKLSWEVVKIKNRKICMRNVKHIQGDKGGRNIEIKLVINKINCR